MNSTLKFLSTHQKLCVFTLHGIGAVNETGINGFYYIMQKCSVLSLVPVPCSVNKPLRSLSFSVSEP